MRHVPVVFVSALLLTACSSPPAHSSGMVDPSTTARPGEGTPPTEYDITQLVRLEHVKADDVIARFQAAGVPEGMVIHRAPNGNSVLLTGRHQLVRKALAEIAAMDK